MERDGIKPVHPVCYECEHEADTTIMVNVNNPYVFACEDHHDKVTSTSPDYVQVHTYSREAEEVEA